MRVLLDRGNSAGMPPDAKGQTDGTYTDWHIGKEVQILKK
jgi:hypothetical protein